MTEKTSKLFELCPERIKTIEDIKNIFKALQIRIDTSNPVYEEVKDYFSTEVVPKGYFKVLEKVGEEQIYKMTWEEIEQMGQELLRNN